MIPLCDNIIDTIGEQTTRLATIHHSPFDGKPTASVLATILEPRNPSIDYLLQQHNRSYPKQLGDAWQTHLVSLSEVQPFLGAAKDGSHKINRCAGADLAGVKVLDELRTGTIGVRSIQAFHLAFHQFTDGALVGLDYSNVFIAGGSVNAVLTETDVDTFKTRLRKSDVDIFLYGLNDKDMLDKILLIEERLRTNIHGFQGKYVTERTAGAITFVPKYEDDRRFQVILRAHANPAEILAHFDLDQARVGFDGERVWLSMLAIRSWITGYTVTMGHIDISDKRHTDYRYAARGWGVLIRLPGENPDGKQEQELQEMVKNKHATLKQDFHYYPWDGINNFGMLYHASSRRVSAHWTYSFSGMMELSALWTIAFESSSIPDLMDELGCSQTHEIAPWIDTEQWIDALNNIVSPLRPDIVAPR
ncbi:hypothetical protein OC844_005947 [Tilletia horrida]|nr:hypothetical protein OC844_005947 [Tilletia horrida]